MSNYEFLPVERETHFNYDDSSPTAQVETYNTLYADKLYKMAQEHPDKVHVCAYHPGHCARIEIPKKWIKISPPPRLSQEQIDRRKLMMLEINSKRAK
jgi:hypothetical protein